MKFDDIQAHFMSYPGAEEETPFGPDVLVYKVCGKMFGLIAWEDDPLNINLKCDPEQSDFLRQEYAAINPGYHMNKKHWNTLTLDGSIPEDLVQDLVRHSYELVIKSLSKQKRDSLKYKVVD